MMLAGRSAAKVKQLIDRGVAADQSLPSGDGYFVKTTDSIRSLLAWNFTTTVANWNRADGLVMNYIDNSSGAGKDYIEGKSNVLFYMTGLTSVGGLTTNSYSPPIRHASNS